MKLNSEISYSIYTRRYFSVLALSTLLSGFTSILIAQEKIYRFGIVPQFEQRKLFRIWVPILKRLEAETGLKFELIGSEQIPAFENRFLAGEFDFSYMNPYHVVTANNKQGYIPLVRDGKRSLQGIIVVHKKSKIKTIKELSGKVVAFPSANALGASLLPRAEFARKYNISVMPRYVKTHSSVYLHVVQDLMIAGGGVQSTLNQQKPKIQELLRVLYRTQKVNPHPIVAHPRVPIQHMKLVQDAFLEMSKSKSGQSLLSKIPLKAAVKATIDDYEPIKKLQLEQFR